MGTVCGNLIKIEITLKPNTNIQYGPISIFFLISHTDTNIAVSSHNQEVEAKKYLW